MRGPPLRDQKFAPIQGAFPNVAGEPSSEGMLRRIALKFTTYPVKCQLLYRNRVTERRPASG